MSIGVVTAMKDFWEILKTDLRRAGLIPQDDQRIKIIRAFMLPLFCQTRVLFLLRLSIDGPRWAHRVSRVLLRSFYFIEIGCNVRLGRAIFLPHPQCIIIGDGVTIGDEVSIGQFTTIGGNYRKTIDRDGVIQKLPIIGSRVMIGPGAVIGGPVIIGNNVVIGANAVITKDCPSNRIVYGLSQISSQHIVVNPIGSYTIIDESHD